MTLSAYFKSIVNAVASIERERKGERMVEHGEED